MEMVNHNTVKTASEKKASTLSTSSAIDFWIIYVHHNMKKQQSKGEAAVGGRLSPEVVELAVAFVLLNAVDDLTGVVGDLGDAGELDEVEFDDEDSVLRVGGLVIWGEDPVVAASETVVAANDEVIIADDGVVAANDDVVVVDEVALDGLQESGHCHHLLVERKQHCVPLPAALANHLRLSSSVASPERAALELVVLVGLLQAGEDRGERRDLRRAIEVEIEGVLERADGNVGLLNEGGIDVQSSKIVLWVDSSGKDKHQKYFR
jgi:hypothetical protein